MNILIFELKAEAKSFIIWTVSLIIVFIIFMSGIYPAFLGSLDSVQEILSNYPPQFTAAFGFDISTMFTYGGFYSFTFGYLGLLGAIMATSISITTFSREKRSKCSDFLLTKPIRRENLFMIKLLANVILLILSNILFVGISLIAYFHSEDKTTSTGTIVLSLLAIFFTQLVFLGMGIFYATFVKKIRSIPGIAMAFGFTSFFLSALINIMQEENLKIIAPLKYFDPYPLLSGGFFELKYVLVAIILTIGCITLSFFKFTTSDTPTI